MPEWAPELAVGAPDAGDQQAQPVSVVQTSCAQLSIVASSAYTGSYAECLEGQAGGVAGQTVDTSGLGPGDLVVSSGASGT